MKSNSLSVAIAIAVAVSFIATASQQDTLEEHYLKACAASKGDRAEYYRIMREAFDVASKMELSGEDLFYTGCVAAKIRKFAEATEYLESYLQLKGKNGAVAAATLVEVHSWRDYEKTRRAYDYFKLNFPGSTAGDPLNRGAPADVRADLGLYIALVRADRATEAIPLLKSAIDRIGDNSDGAIDDGALLNYHTWYASLLEENEGWEAAIAFLQEKTMPLFNDDPAFNAKVRDRIQFAKLRHYVETDQYEKGLKELQETVESYKADAGSYKRVSKALKRFSLYKQPAPEIVHHAWIGGNETNLAGLRGKVVMFELFTTG